MKLSAVVGQLRAKVLGIVGVASCSISCKAYTVHLKRGILGSLWVGTGKAHEYDAVGTG